MTDTAERQPVTIETDGGALELVLMVRKMERRHEPAPALLGGDRIGIEAEIEVATGDQKGPTYLLSRLTGEADWVIDAKFGANGFPHYSHGFGSRVTIPRGLPDEICDLLDSEARNRGMVRAIGRGTPLQLAG
ncbi:hypothetical protein [Streptomyces sp. V1I6]|uniref:hypothetical protein n=1 Tax=Streptomyces sp. V1I6 TaxID=3042273 RepID=UPI00277FE6A5|nr:hypothetical protein [Streptomyces sp. V1I6]MDQ0847766.1 hypothetical protein [Streptomyces sp. V1I6]